MYLYLYLITAGLDVIFSEVDYPHNVDSDTVTVLVLKQGANIGPVNVRLYPLTLSRYRDTFPNSALCANAESSIQSSAKPAQGMLSIVAINDHTQRTTITTLSTIPYYFETPP